jgi:hypothetical protein
MKMHHEPYSKVLDSNYLKLIALTTEMWNERKGLDYTRMPGERKRAFARIEKHTIELENLVTKLKEEIEIDKELYINHLK